MEFDAPLVPARLVRRYKRFLADVILEDGREATAHCANPGAMTGVADPGATVWLEPSLNPKRKLPFSWKLVELPGGHMAGIDTALPNRVVGEALRAGQVAALAAYGTIRPEVRYGARSRVDFLLSGAGLPDCYVEVKNVHLRRAGRIAEFPDSVTARGARHMAELARMVASGHRAVLVYLVQRDDCDTMQLAADIDPAYATAVLAARDAGVEILCYGTRITRQGVWLDQPLRFALPG